MRRPKSPEHREKIRAAMLGNLNALKSGRYAKREKPAATCNQCPMASRCPQYHPGNACVFIWDALNRTARTLGL